MSDTKATPTLKNTTTELAAKIREQIKIDPATGQATIDKDFYATTLPEGITIDTLKSIADHHTAFVPAAAKALGEAATDFAKTNKDHENVSLSIPTVGKDAWSLDWRRSKQVMHPQTKETSTKYGTITAKYDMYATGNHGEFAKVKALMSEAATAALAD